MLTFVYVYFCCNALSHIHILMLIHAPPQTPLIKTNSSHAPHPPKTHPIISFSHPCLSPLPPSIVPSHLALWGRWASQDPTVIGLDIIYCPLGNVAFQHLIKIISSHSNGRYGLKGTHCNHLDTRRGSCSLSLSLTLFFLLGLCGPVSL